MILDHKFNLFINVVGITNIFIWMDKLRGHFGLTSKWNKASCPPRLVAILGKEISCLVFFLSLPGYGIREKLLKIQLQCQNILSQREDKTPDRAFPWQVRKMDNVEYSLHSIGQQLFSWMLLPWKAHCFILTALLLEELHVDKA